MSSNSSSKKTRNKSFLDLIFLKIFYTSGKTYTLKFAYSDLKSKETQEQLRNIYSACKNNNVKRIKCLCRKDKDTSVHIRKKSNKYIIASNPNKKQNHSNYCLLGNKINNYIDTENTEPKLKNFRIFEPPPYLTKKKTSNKKIHDEKTKKLTFSLIMGLALGEAYQFAFASKNKINGQKVSRCSPIFPANMPSNIEVINKFYPKFKSFFNKKGINSFENFKKNYTLKAGIVENFNVIEPEGILEMEVKYYLSPENSKNKISLLTIPRHRISNLILSEKALSISTPPLFIALIEKKYSNEITRAYVYPLLYSDIEKPFIPIDSKHEKTFIEEIYNHGIRFIKPLKVNLTWHLFFTNLDIYKYLIEYTYTPDLIIFKGGNIILTEIIDKGWAAKNKKYQINLTNKRELCNKIKDKIHRKANNCNLLCLEVVTSDELISRLEDI